MFSVDVATAPESNEALPHFCPDFKSYQLVIPNYTDFGNGGAWAPRLKSAFVEHVAGGRGIVIVRGASSAFPNWGEFNEIAGLGWVGRPGPAVGALYPLSRRQAGM